MASKFVEDTVDAYLATEWLPLHPEAVILNENQEQEAPGDGRPFVVTQYPVASTTRPPVSTRLYVEEGAFRLAINVERGAGTATMRAWGEELTALFRDVDLAGGIQCFVPTAPFTDSESDQGVYFKGSIVVPYRYTYRAP